MGAMIPEAAVEAAARALLTKEVGGAFDDRLYAEDLDACCEDARDALEAAYPILAAQVLRDAVEAFPLETITAPDNAVVWLRRRADEMRAK